MIKIKDEVFRPIVLPALELILVGVKSSLAKEAIEMWKEAFPESTIKTKSDIIWELEEKIKEEKDGKSS